MLVGTFVFTSLVVAIVIPLANPIVTIVFERQVSFGLHDLNYCLRHLFIDFAGLWYTSLWTRFDTIFTLHGRWCVLYSQRPHPSGILCDRYFLFICTICTWISSWIHRRRWSATSHIISCSLCQSFPWLVFYIFFIMWCSRYDDFFFLSALTSFSFTSSYGSLPRHCYIHRNYNLPYVIDSSSRTNKKGKRNTMTGCRTYH